MARAYDWKLVIRTINDTCSHKVLGEQNKTKSWHLYRLKVIQDRALIYRIKQLFDRQPRQRRRKSQTRTTKNLRGTGTMERVKRKKAHHTQIRWSNDL